MRVLRFAAPLAILAACGPETTSFRTTDRGDGSDRPTSAAYYSLRDATIHVWSNGGYVSSSNEPTTHVGFEIQNAGTRRVVFDVGELGLDVFDSSGAPLPATRFVTVTPLGPAQLEIAKGTTTFDAYFLLPVRPRMVGKMAVRWTLRIGTTTETETTNFVRDDAGPVVAPPSPDEPDRPNT